MEFLNELGRIITKFPKQREDIIGINLRGRPQNLSNRLLEGIQAEKYATDQAAIKDLYGDQSTAGTFGVLKSRVRTRLLNTLFVLDPKPPDYSESTSAFYHCQKGLFWSSVLLRFGARNAAIRIVRTTLKLAHSNQFTSIELELLSFLRGHYGLTGEIREFEETDRKLKYALRMLEAELTGREYLERITIKFAGASAERPELAALAREYSNHLDELRKHFDNFNIHLNYHRLHMLGYQIAQDYRETIRACEEASVFLRAHPMLAPAARLGEFALMKLVCYLQLGDYDAGKKSVDECVELFPVGRNNWFFSMEYYFFLSMHTEHFEEANTVFESVVSHPRFSSLPEHKRETWKIFELYLRYVQHSFTNTPPLREVTTASNSRPGKSLDRKKILRMVPTYSRDKQGYNIALLVIHILYLLDQRDLEGIIDRMEALKAYRTRYLKMSTNRQSALFFKLLLIMESNSFKYTATKSKGEKYYQQLLKSTPNSEEFNECLQVLPFSWIWLRVLEKLEQIEKVDNREQRG